MAGSGCTTNSARIRRVGPVPAVTVPMTGRVGRRSNAYRRVYTAPSALNRLFLRTEPSSAELQLRVIDLGHAGSKEVRTMARRSRRADLLLLGRLTSNLRKRAEESRRCPVHSIGAKRRASSSHP